MTQELLNAIEIIKALKSDLFYQIEMKHGAEKASKYPSIVLANDLLSDYANKNYSYEPKGEFVNDGNDYEICGYAFNQKTDDEGSSYFEVVNSSFDESVLDELYGVEFPDENDLESIQIFESTLITWLKGAKLI